jgi:GMP synthase-like glutamine amidotransferase
MNDVLIVKNVSHEGPGLLQEVLDSASVSATVIDLDKGEAFPSPLGYKAVIVLGGPNSANDATPKMTQELEQIKIALDTKIPYLGICLGMQTLVKAGGGTVIPGAQKEIGFIDPSGNRYTIELTKSDKDDLLLAGLASSLAVFHLHGETVMLTDSMQLLGTGKYCENQIIKVTDTAYGIQSHFELTEEMLREWAKKDPDLLPIGEDTLVASYKTIQSTYNEIGRTIFTNFLKIAGLL